MKPKCLKNKIFSVLYLSDVWHAQKIMFWFYKISTHRAQKIHNHLDRRLAWKAGVVGSISTSKYRCNGTSNAFTCLLISIQSKIFIWVYILSQYLNPANTHSLFCFRSKICQFWEEFYSSMRHLQRFQVSKGQATKY